MNPVFLSICFTVDLKNAGRYRPFSSHWYHLGTMVTLLSLFAEMERMMISRRTKEALATKKAQGIKLGKPVGTLQLMFRS